MSEKNKILLILGVIITITILLVTVTSVMASQPQIKVIPVEPAPSFVDELKTVKIEPVDNINGINLEQLLYEKQTAPVIEEEAEATQEYVVALAEATPEPSPQPVVLSSVRSRSFRLNNGAYQTGQQIIDYVVGNHNGKLLYDAFLAAHGQEVADKAAISLFYENGTLWELTTGVCSSQFWINGDYRNCNYADINSAGFDAGLKQINTFYQRYRIAKLGGPSCEPINSRDRTDACTQQLIAWLHNIDNNIRIALDIYAESGFSPWYGYKRAFNV